MSRTAVSRSCESWLEPALSPFILPHFLAADLFTTPTYLQHKPPKNMAVRFPVYINRAEIRNHDVDDSMTGPLPPDCALWRFAVPGCGKS